MANSKHIVPGAWFGYTFGGYVNFLILEVDERDKLCKVLRFDKTSQGVCYRTKGTFTGPAYKLYYSPAGGGD